jgi:hypothetical protein
MGPGNTKLLDLDSIKSSFKSQAVAIQAVAGRQLGADAASEALALARVARACSHDIRKRVGRGWHTGHAKFMDTVVGYMIGKTGTA